MTTLYDEETAWGVCGTNSTQRVIGSTNTFGGSPDLDTRPPEMARSTIYHKIQRCPSCGYCAYVISECLPNAETIIESDGYRNILENENRPDSASAFLALSYLQQQSGEFDSAAWSAIAAAWICDDHENEQESQKCRLQGLSMIEKAKAESQEFSEEPGATQAVSIDLMRRVGMFEEAMSLAKVSLQSDDMLDIIQDIIRFEMELIKSKDTGVHTIAETEKE